MARRQVLRHPPQNQGKADPTGFQDALAPGQPSPCRSTPSPGSTQSHPADSPGLLLQRLFHLLPALSRQAPFPPSSSGPRQTRPRLQAERNDHTRHPSGYQGQRNFGSWQLRTDQPAGSGVASSPPALTRAFLLQSLTCRPRLPSAQRPWGCPRRDL